MIVLDLEQGSQAWLNARLGIPTASRFKDIITPAKADRSKSAAAYMYELLAERLTKEPNEFYANEWMQRGNELEPMARTAYEFITDNSVDEVGFILNDEKSIGVSPDGLVGADGGIEIKCPKASTMVKYMIEDKLPDIYKPQVQGNLWISGREWWDFIVYHPSIELYVKRVYRDEAYIKKMEEHITAFVSELEKMYQVLNPDKEVK